MVQVRDPQVRSGTPACHLCHLSTTHTLYSALHLTHHSSSSSSFHSLLPFPPLPSPPLPSFSSPLLPPLLSPPLPSPPSPPLSSLSSRWWPCEVLPQKQVPEHLLKMKPADCMFLVRFFGTGEHWWAHHGRCAGRGGAGEGMHGQVFLSGMCL